jgi:hypothetical protein
MISGIETHLHDLQTTILSDELKRSNLYYVPLMYLLVLPMF